MFIGTARKQTNTWVDQLDEQTLEISGGAGDRQTTKTASTSDDSGQSFPALYQTSMEKLRGKQEMQLLEHVSHALHDEARHYPITRAFHVMSMSLLAAEHGKNTHARDTETAGLNNHRYTSIFDKKRGTCEDLRGDPRRNKCMGMCGPKCWCWTIVCKDCCFHTGCYQHDQCCSKSRLSGYCLFPFFHNFGCNSYGGYPACL